MTVQNTKPTQHRGGKKGGGWRGIQSNTSHFLAISGQQHVLKELTLFFTGASEIRTTVLREFEGTEDLQIWETVPVLQLRNQVMEKGCRT